MSHKSNPDHEKGVYRSWQEIAERYFGALPGHEPEPTEDPDVVGAMIAEKYIERIRAQLARSHGKDG